MGQLSLTNLFRDLPSQTSLDERVGLHNLAADLFTGQGAIYDIGTAAGGSTYCLAHGLEKNNSIPEKEKNRRIYGFDLFAGYSIKAFSKHPTFLRYQKERGKPFQTDLELFNWVTKDYAKYIQAIPMDILKGFTDYPHAQEIEIAHIDAAKSLDLWKIICPVVSTKSIPGLTTMVFQDFERCRLPFQWLYIAELIKTSTAEFSGFYKGGTAHLKILKPITAKVALHCSNMNFSEQDAIRNFEFLREIVEDKVSKTEIFGGPFDSFEDTANCLLAYIYLHYKNKSGVDAQVKKLTYGFLEKHSLYRQELGL